MNHKNNEPGSNDALMSAYREPRADLKVAIMNGIVTNQLEKKSWKRKEKRIMLIYVGALFIALLFLLFLGGLQAGLPILLLPAFEERELIVYYKLFIACLIFSLLAFVIYYLKSHSSHIRIDMESPV